MEKMSYKMLKILCKGCYVRAMDSASRKGKDFKDILCQKCRLTAVEEYLNLAVCLPCKRVYWPKEMG